MIDWEAWAKAHLEELAEDAEVGRCYLSANCPQCGRRRLEPLRLVTGLTYECEKCEWPYHVKPLHECPPGCDCTGCYLSNRARKGASDE